MEGERGEREEGGRDREREREREKERKERDRDIGRGRDGDKVGEMQSLYYLTLCVSTHLQQPHIQCTRTCMHYMYCTAHSSWSSPLPLSPSPLLPLHSLSPILILVCVRCLPGSKDGPPSGAIQCLLQLPSLSRTKQSCKTADNSKHVQNVCTCNCTCTCSYTS